jgi:DNA processing protein
VHDPTAQDAATAMTVAAAAVTNGTAHLVRIRAEHSGDTPGVSLVGLPAAHARTTNDRLYAGLRNAGLTWPAGPLTLTVLGPELPAGDSSLDLAFAVALLAATGQIPADQVTDLACLAELGLDGSLRPVPALTARARAVADAAIGATLVAAVDLPAATRVLGTAVYPSTGLADLVTGLREHRSGRRRAGAVMRAQGLDGVRAARAALARFLPPGDAGAATLLAGQDLVDVLAQLRAGTPQEPVRRLLDRVDRRHLATHAASALSTAGRAGARIVIPEDDEWPPQVADLATAPAESADGAALCLWVRGDQPLSDALHRSVALVGSAGPTAYGLHVATALGHDLAGHQVTTLGSGGFGICAAAHTGTLTGHGSTVAVLPGGVDRAHPAAHADLFDRIAERGLLVSPWPPGAHPTLARFTATARLLGALAAGTVLVEASQRSRALAVLRQAISAGRTAMVVPGPVTSALSAGNHQALREYPQARLVRDAADVIADLAHTTT